MWRSRARPPTPRASSACAACTRSFEPSCRAPASARRSSRRAPWTRPSGTRSTPMRVRDSRSAAPCCSRAMWPRPCCSPSLGPRASTSRRSACCRRSTRSEGNQLRIGDCGLRIGKTGDQARSGAGTQHNYSAIRNPQSAIIAGLFLVCAPILARAQSRPPLPDTTGFGVHVLALGRAPDDAVWVGTYGQGIFVLRRGAGGWEQVKHSDDSTARTISFDFVHAFGFGPNGEIWYGTVGNGWGLSTDGGKTWTNWELKQLGPEWQYVAPNGIVTRGDTVYVGTADGIKLSWDRGTTWAEITDSADAITAPHPWGRLRSQYVLALGRDSDGSLWAGHLRGLARSTNGAP